MPLEVLARVWWCLVSILVKALIVKLAKHFSHIVNEEYKLLSLSFQLLDQEVKDFFLVDFVGNTLVVEGVHFLEKSSKRGVLVFQVLGGSFPELEEAIDAIVGFFLEDNRDKPRVELRVALYFVAEAEQEGGFAHAPLPLDEVMLLGILHLTALNIFINLPKNLQANHEVFDQLLGGLLVGVVGLGDEHFGTREHRRSRLAGSVALPPKLQKGRVELIQIFVSFII